MPRKMKESNVEWIGKIPDEWKIVKAKNFFIERKDKGNEVNLEILTPSQKYGVIPQWKYQEVTGTKLVQVNENADLSSFRTVHIGDFCISLSSYMGGFEFSEYEGVISPAYHCFYCITKDYNKYYLKYLFKNILFIDEVNKITPQSVRVGRNTSFENFKYVNLPLPSVNEQKNIANYLDKKVKKIEKVIEDNKKIIELIEEYKKEYLEKKFNEISEGSKKTRLKYLGNLQNGISAGTEKFGHGKGTFINYGDVYNYDVIPNNPKGIVELSDKEIEKYSLKRGDILFTRTSETIEEVGISAVCIKDYPNSAFSGFVIRFRPFNTEIMLPDFYKYYFKLKIHRDYFAREMNLVTRASLSQGLLGNIITLVPSMKKQNIIVNEINKRFDNLDTTINYRKQIIEKLEEYKKSLIYEVVTGKIEVKG